MGGFVGTPVVGNVVGALVGAAVGTAVGAAVGLGVVVTTGAGVGGMELVQIAGLLDDKSQTCF